MLRFHSLRVVLIENECNTEYSTEKLVNNKKTTV